MAREIDEATLLLRCEAGGRSISRAQLKRWRRAGVLQRARQEHLLGARGSISWSPEEAVEQALTVATLLADGRRKTEWVLVQLWWRGMWVDRAALRVCLIDHFDPISRDARTLAESYDDPADAADAAVRAVDWGELSEIVALMLARLGGRRRGRRALEDIMWFVFLLAFGGEYEPAPPSDGSPGLEEVTAQATGIDSAKRDAGPLGTPWLAQDIAGLGFVRDLRRAGALKVMDLAAPIRDASDDDLDRARDDARMFSGELATIAAAAQLMLGDDVGGLGSLTAMAAAVHEDAYILIYAMLVLRRALGDAPFNAIRELTQQEGPRAGAIVELATAVPGVERLLDDQRGDELHRDIAAQVAELLQRRPELLAAIEGDEAGSEALDTRHL
jgi:hypothetical protein